MVSAWRNFKNIFPKPLFIIIYRSEMLKFHPYSILTGDTRFEFVIYGVLCTALPHTHNEISSFLEMLLHTLLLHNIVLFLYVLHFIHLKVLTTFHPLTYYMTCSIVHTKVIYRTPQTILFHSMLGNQTALYILILLVQ